METTFRSTDPTRGYTRGRIRVDEETAEYLVWILDRERARVLTARAELSEQGESSAVTAYNRKLRQLSKLIDELAATAQEKGWRSSLSLLDRLYPAASAD